MKRHISLAAFITILLVVGCKRKEQVSPEAFREVAEDMARLEGEQSHTNSIADEQGEIRVLRRVGGADSTLLPPCAQVSYDSVQRLLTIDFGRTNCLCRDGVYRRGKILVQFSGPRWRQAGARAFITTDSFFVNDNQHIIQKVLFHEGLNASGERVLRDTVISHQVITPDGTVQWSATRTYRQTQGQNTLNRRDDVWLIEGGAQGTSRRGRPFSTQIIDPLKVVISCVFEHPVKGIWRLTTQNHTVTLNYDPYGNEACDRVASLQVDNGSPVNITLR
ncbi:MAG: hypothetical protein N2253_02985 [Bacteroidia bacterium]|nr:hypothetical protein [Bacteroidia bacterium]MCX7763843.1 hypothetical protein [Bacteroidia bacterium]MDW8056677.1 hypothetical protein [Bacteroidia bacterium]